MKLGEMKIGKRKIYTMMFDGTSDLAKHCEAAGINHSVFHYQSSIESNPSFTLTESFGEANNLLMNGWTQGSEKLTKELKIANIQNQGKDVKKLIHDIVGFQVNVPRYLQGIPTHMVNQKIVKQKQKVITLVKSICYLGHVKADKIMEDSIKFLQIVQGIEAKGIRVNVEVFFHAIKNSEEIYIRVPIKRSSERLNISKMSYPLTHPSFLRRHIFRAMETEMRIKNRWCPGYGTTGSKEQVESLLKDNEYFIPVLISQREAEYILGKIN